MSNSYPIKFADPAKNNLNNEDVGIYVPEQQSYPISNLTLIGRNWPGYAQAIDQNFVYLLENSASPSPPDNPTEGQLWYDNVKHVLKVSDGVAGWIPVNGVYEQAPNEAGRGPSSAKPGDIWVNTDTSILYIYNGSDWILVGPTDTSGTKTGAYPTTVNDRDGNSHNIIIMYLDDVAIEIIAKESFQPSPTIYGFNNLSIGVNISSAVGSVTPVFNGLATRASSLQQISSTGLIQNVSGNNFVRNDTSQASINGQLIINNDNGLRIGLSTSTVIIQKSHYKAVFINSEQGGQFTFNTINPTGTPFQALTIDNSQQNVSRPRVGINNNNPSVELDVTGNAHVTGQLKVSYSTDVTSSTNAIFAVGGDSYLQGALSVSESLAIGKISSFLGTATFSAGIQTTDTTKNIGSLSSPFNTLYIKTIGNTNTTYTTEFIGVLRGGADNFNSSRSVSLSGPIQTTSAKNFGGRGDPNLTTLVTTVTNSIVTGLLAYPKSTVFSGGATLTPDTSDLIMIYTAGANNTPTPLTDRAEGVYKVSKKAFLADITPSLTPAGMIAPYGGTSAPSGWVLCDGNGYPINNLNYANLYSVIGNTYGFYSAGSANYFQVPDLGSTLYTNTNTNSPTSLGVNYIIKL